MTEALASIQLGPWHGGLRKDLPVEEVGVQELFRSTNIRVGSAGEIEPRRGTDEYQDAAAISGTPTETMLAEFDVTATTTVVVKVAGTAIYKYASGWSAITGSVTVTAGDDNTFEWANANGVLVATNGVDTNAWKWTGTSNATDLDDDSRFSKGKHIAWWDNRLWIGNVDGATGQLWRSDTADIETWGATSYYNFGGIVLGIVPAQNVLIVHTSIGMFSLAPTGSATEPYHPDKLTDDAGVDGRSCVTIPGDLQLMIQAEGIYEWSGGSQLRKISDALDKGYWPYLNSSRFIQSFALRVPLLGEVWFFLPYGTSQTNMNHIMVYNYRQRTIVHGQDVGIWYGPYTGWERNTAALIDGKVHAGDFDGKTWDHDDETIADNLTTVFNPRAETGAPAPLGDDVQVAFVNVRHYYDAQTSDASISVEQKSEGAVGELQILSLKSDGFTLDEDLLDSGVQLASEGLLSQDTPLLGFAPQTSIQLTQSTASTTFAHRKMILHYENLGTPTKPQPNE